MGDRCELFLSASSNSLSSSRSTGGGGGGALSLLVAFRRLAGRSRGDLLLPFLAFSDDLRTGLLGEDSALVAAAAAEVLRFVCETGLLDRDGDIGKSSKGTGEWLLVCPIEYLRDLRLDLGVVLPPSGDRPLLVSLPACSFTVTRLAMRLELLRLPRGSMDDPRRSTLLRLEFPYKLARLLL